MAVSEGPFDLSKPAWVWEEPNRRLKGSGVTRVFHSSPIIDGEYNTYIQSTTGWVYSISKAGGMRWEFNTGDGNPGNLALQDGVDHSVAFINHSIHTNSMAAFAELPFQHCSQTPSRTSSAEGDGLLEKSANPQDAQVHAEALRSRQRGSHSSDVRSREARKCDVNVLRPLADLERNCDVDVLRPLADLEEQLEEDYSQHLTTRNTHQMCKYGAMGVGIGGALGLAAAPFVVPVVAVGALFAGGASGLNFALQKDRRERSKIPGTDTCSSRPSLRRLKFLVDWGHLKLVEYESSPPEWGAKVLDDVVISFSPWVQQLYLLRARRRADAEADAEVKAGVGYLLPLYYFLQRTVCLMALLKTAEITAAAFKEHVSGTSWLSACLDRCRVGFPTILETISTVDRLSPSIAPRTPGRQRLRRIVSAIHATLSESTVKEALALGHSSPKFAVKSKCPEFTEFPPEGVEDEHSPEEQDYYSVSEASSPRGSPPSPRVGRPGTEVTMASFQQRSAAFVKGTGDHTWNTFDASNYFVRSASYLTSRRKEPSKPGLFQLVSIDCCNAPPDGPVRHVSATDAFYPALHWRNGDSRFLFVLNLVSLSMQVVLSGVADLAAQRLSPQARDLLHSFLEMSLEERRSRLKLIVAVEDGPWLVRSVCPNTKKPVIIAKTLQVDFHQVEDKYLEATIDVTGKTWETIIGLVQRHLKRIILSLALIIEGRCEAELPEVVLLSGKVMRVDASRCPCPEGTEAHAFAN